MRESLEGLKVERYKVGSRKGWGPNPHEEKSPEDFKNSGEWRVRESLKGLKVERYHVGKQKRFPSGSKLVKFYSAKAT